MIDPELTEALALMPEIDLSDPVAARAGFAAMSAGLRTEIPGIETLDIEDRLVAGWEGEPEVAVRVYRPRDRRVRRPACC